MTTGLSTAGSSASRSSLMREIRAEPGGRNNLINDREHCFSTHQANPRLRLSQLLNGDIGEETHLPAFDQMPQTRPKISTLS
ncbi:hypothetical protein [Ktedonospora formicarum]|uniref:hypothetical protein n=1 Tax=Ktedonospora formicarum TaxID=2778364 RepID=UPI001C693B28|nr:hypothetical protein [Ktedonospora formicarum]